MIDYGHSEEPNNIPAGQLVPGVRVQHRRLERVWVIQSVRQATDPEYVILEIAQFDVGEVRVITAHKETKMICWGRV